MSGRNLRGARGGRRKRKLRGSQPSPPRHAALNASLIAGKRGIHLESALEECLEALGIDERDRRLAEEIAYGTVRYRKSLDAVIEAAASRPVVKIQAAVLEAMRGAIYQSFYLSRIPPRAAINEAVTLARALAGEKAVGFTNAVLRAAQQLFAGRASGQIAPENRRKSLYFRNGEYVILSSRLLPAPETSPEDWMALHYSYPRWLIGRLCSQFGNAATEDILRWGNQLPHTSVRLNPLRVAPEELQASDTAELTLPGRIFAGCSSVRPGPLAGSWLITAVRSPAGLPGLQRGLFSVQDTAQQEVAPALEPAPGQVILDLCAAPGGKTCHLAELCNDDVSILACDCDAERLSLVPQGARRLGLKSIATRHQELPPLPEDLRSGFDRVLADVPCSNTGAMNRRPEARWKGSDDAEKRLTGLQAQILECGLQALKPGGRLVYSTCSILRAENEDVVSEVLKAHPELRLIRQKTTLPEADLCDGGYYAVVGS